MTLTFKSDLRTYLRNQPIANILYLCKDVETCGHDLKKIYSLYKEANVDVSFISNENDFTIEFSQIDRSKSGKINGEISKDEIAILH